MLFTRRLIAGGVATAAVTLAAGPGVSTPASISAADTSDWIPIQSSPSLLTPPPPPLTPQDFADPKLLENYLSKRFQTRIAPSEVVVDDGAASAIQEFTMVAAREAFEPQRGGKVDRSRDYRVLPLNVRRAIILRNFDTLTDLLVVVALTESKKITRATIGSVRDFVCPLYPFCA